MSEYVPNGQPQLTAFGFDLDAGSRACLRDFVARLGERIDSIADEFVRHLVTNDSVSASLCAASIDEARLTLLARSWINEILIGTDNAQDEGARLTGCLRSILLVPSHQQCVTRGLALVRRRLIGLCLCATGERASYDLASADFVERAIDLELDAILEINRQAVTERLATVERMAEIGQLVASVGHELRNPLGAIETSAYLLSQRLTDLAAAEPGVGKHLDKIRRHVRAASKMANALLELARQRSPRCTPTELGATLRVVLEDLERSDGVNVEVDVPENLSVWADGDQLRVVLTNLLSNAFESVEQSGTIRIVATHCASGTTLLVADDGPGIAPSGRPHIFELLHTTKRKGTGLGLPLCQRIAAAHGGSLALQPSEHGTKFRLWLPNRMREA